MVTPIPEITSPPALSKSFHQLGPPEPSRTPELTSRSLHRIPDGFVLAFDSFGIEGLSLDDVDRDGDVDWRKNLCTEPEDFQSRFESNSIQKLMQGDIDGMKGSESAADMESDTGKLGISVHEMNTSWGSQNKKMDDNVLPSNQRVEYLPEDVRNNDMDFKECNRIDGYTPDHDEYYRKEEKLEGGVGVKQIESPEAFSIQGVELRDGRSLSDKTAKEANKGTSVRPVAGGSTEVLENRFSEKVANNRPSHPAEGLIASSSTFELFQSPIYFKLYELHKQVEYYQEQVEYERQQKQILAHRFAEQNKEFESTSQAKQNLWESKLRELQKDKYTLQIRLQAVEGDKAKHRIKRSGETINLTEEELRFLRQEIMEQEALIKGYQVENEKAVKRLKDIELTYKERAQLMAEENARLASQLANIQFSGRHTTVYGSTPNASKEIQALRTELHDLQSRENLLKLEVEKERKTNQDLARSLAVVNQSKERELEALKEMIAKERTEHARAIDDKEEKNRLYLQSQELVKSLQSTIEDQASVISDLRNKVESLDFEEEIGKEDDNGGGRSIQDQKVWSFNQKEKAMKRIEVLQKQVKDLETALKLANDLSNVNQQTCPSNLDETGMVRRLQEEVLTLQHLIRNDESKHELQNLKQEHEQLKQECALKVCALTQQLRNPSRASGAENDPSAVKKVKDLEKQVEEVRAFYLKKVKDQSKQLADARKEISKMRPSLELKKEADKSAGKVTYLKQSTDQVAKLEGALISRDKSVKKLQMRIKEFEAGKGGNFPASSSEEVVLLRKQLEAAEIAREAIQKTCTEAMERAALMSVQHQQMIVSLKEAHAMEVPGAQTCQRKNMEGGRRKFKNQILERDNEVEDARMMKESMQFGTDPRLAQLNILRQKIEDMEARQRDREWEWKQLMEERVSQHKPDEDEQIWKTTLMTTKKQEIESLRNEVDLVLEAALAFQNSQLQEADGKGAGH